eukprot:scaffold98330_cov23-Tisochrysis_lutea.AAC.1
MMRLAHLVQTQLVVYASKREARDGMPSDSTFPKATTSSMAWGRMLSPGPLGRGKGAFSGRLTLVSSTLELTSLRKLPLSSLIFGEESWLKSREGIERGPIMLCTASAPREHSGPRVNVTVNVTV